MAYVTPARSSRGQTRIHFLYCSFGMIDSRITTFRSALQFTRQLRQYDVKDVTLLFIRQASAPFNMANLLQIMCSIEYNNIFAIFSLKMLPRTDLWKTLRYFMIIMVLLLTSTALMETRIFNVSIKMSFLGFLIVFCGYCHYLPESYRKQLTYHRTRFISLIHCFCPFPRVTSVLKK